jgi:hypothetical protein
MKSSIDLLTLFGLFAVTAMLVFYALEDRSPWFILGFAGACVLASAYGFLQGAWPFGIVEAIWGLVAIQRSPSVGGVNRTIARNFYGIRSAKSHQPQDRSGSIAAVLALRQFSL